METRTFYESELKELFQKLILVLKGSSLLLVQVCSHRIFGSGMELLCRHVGRSRNSRKHIGIFVNEIEIEGKEQDVESKEVQQR